MMFPFYVLHFQRAPFLERFACIPSSLRLLGFHMGLLLFFSGAQRYHFV